MSFNKQSLKAKSQTRIFSDIRKSQNQYGVNASTLILENNQKRENTYDIFLSHSFKDADLILGILETLNTFGYSVYVDWIDDPLLDRTNVNKSNANILKTRMLQSKCLLYATTENSLNSKWMPWEIGFMDGKKDRACILPIFENENSSTDSYIGQEYLGIYPYCIKSTYHINPNVEGLWVCDASDIYVTFDGWLDGFKPTKQ